MNDLRGLLVCPACHGTLTWDGGNSACTRCAAAYAFAEGIPVLVSATTEHAAAQAAYFDEQQDDEWEIARPTGAPAFYAWNLREKFRRATTQLHPVIAGGTAFVACGGSGMDAEFLAQAGAQVVTADISPGAARRAQIRARRHGVEFLSIVADAERLPLRDASVDVAYVHDGLHHVERPLAALRELARVARAVAVTEPARAAATAVAVRLGIAEEREEAGNRVGRFSLDEICRELEATGFRVLEAQRYAMFYRHVPGLPTHVLSTPLALPLAVAASRFANSVVGRAGNKLVVQATRTGADRRAAPSSGVPTTSGS